MIYSSEKIPGILWDLIQDGDCFLWIGAGLSIPAKYPDWGQAISQLCDAFKKHGIEDLKPNERSADSYLNKADECKKKNLDLYYKTLESIFGNRTVPTRRAYYDVMLLPFKGYITTNYDPLLLDACLHSELYNIYSYPHLPYSLIDKFTKPVFYIHGLARREDRARGDYLIVSKTEYDYAYDNDRGDVKHFLSSLFREHPVLFIGSRLNEDYIRYILKTLHQSYKDAKAINPKYQYPYPKKIILLEMDLRNLTPDEIIKEENKIENEDKYFNTEFGIDVIRFDKSDDRFEGIEIIINELIKRRDKQVPADKGKKVSQERRI